MEVSIFQHKHDQALIDVFIKTRPEKISGDKGTQWVLDLHEVALMLTTDNPNFNEESFLEECYEGAKVNISHVAVHT